MSKFWRGWLSAWCAAVCAFGVFLMCGAFEATQAPVRALYAFINPVAEFPDGQALRFSIGLMGAVSLGWGLTLFATVRAALSLGEAGRPVWVGLLWSVGVWYVVDGAISIMTGYALNAVSNTVLAAGLLAPLLASGVLRAGNAPGHAGAGRPAPSAAG